MFYFVKFKQFLFFFILLALCSCGTKEAPHKLEPIKSCTFPDTPNQIAPLWVCHVEIEGYPVTGVGSVEKSKAGIHFMMQQAATQARLQIAQELKTYIDSEVKNFIESNKIGDSETVKNISTIITSQITQNNLIGSRVIRSSISNNGVLYVLVGINPENYKATLKNITDKASRENLSKHYISGNNFADLQNNLLNKPSSYSE